MSIEVDPDWWKTLFDDIYLVTDARSVCDDDLTRREVDLYCELIPLKPAHNILDLCGGHGRHSLELCRRGFNHCTVLDYSQNLLQTGARNAACCNHAIAFVQGDARNIQMPSDSCHHVLILGNSLGYMTDPEDDLQILRESYRLLEYGGWLLIDVTDGQAVRRHFNPNAWHEIGNDVVVCRQRELNHDVIRAREMVLNKKSGLVRDKTYCMRLYTADSLTGLVSAAGFFNISIKKDFSPNKAQGDLGFMNHRMVITAQKSP